MCDLLKNPAVSTFVRKSHVCTMLLKILMHFIPSIGNSEINLQYHPLLFLDNFHQDGKYSAQIAIHQAELSREENFTDQKSLNIYSLQTDYLNLDSSVSGSIRHNERAYYVQKK